MAKASRRGFDPGDVVFGVPTEKSIMVTKGFEVTFIQEARSHQLNVEGNAAMTLAEDESIPLWVVQSFWTDTKNVFVEDSQDFNDGKSRGQMPPLSLHQSLKDASSPLQGC